MPTTRSTGRTWTTKTLTTLFDMTAEGSTQAQIAKRLRRTPKAIERKAAKVRKALATELRRKSYLKMTFPAICTSVYQDPKLFTRVSAAIADGRI